MGTQLSWPWILHQSQENARLMDRLGSGGPEEIEALLEGLEEAASEGDPKALNLLGFGLHVAGRRQAAVNILQLLTDHDPADTAGWLNLARAYSVEGSMDRVAAPLESAITLGREEPLRRLAELRLAEFHSARLEEEIDRTLAQQQAATLRERVATGAAEPADHVRLCKILLRLVNARDGNVTGDEVLAAARDASRVSPGDPAALELLVTGLMVAGTDDDELQQAMRELERVSPHSKVLEVLRTRPPRNTGQVVEDLVARTWRGDREAEAQLRDRSRAFPRNQTYRVALMMAAAGRHEWAQASRLADELAAGPTIEHETHFHLAQFYTYAKERDKARHHFDMAWRTARDDADRQTVTLAMETVGFQP